MKVYICGGKSFFCQMPFGLLHCPQTITNKIGLLYSVKHLINSLNVMVGTVSFDKVCDVSWY